MSTNFSTEPPPPRKRRICFGRFLGQTTDCFWGLGIVERGELKTQHIFSMAHATLIFTIRMGIPKLSRKVVFFWLLAATLATTQDIAANACIEYSSGACIRCSEDTHFYQNYCYRNIIGCKSYVNGSICS